LIDAHQNRKRCLASLVARADRGFDLFHVGDVSLEEDQAGYQLVFDPSLQARWGFEAIETTYDYPARCRFKLAHFVGGR
jgi:hypothetical protein